MWAGTLSGLLFALALPPFYWAGFIWWYTVPLLTLFTLRPSREVLVAAYSCGLIATSQATYGVFGHDVGMGLIVLLVSPLWAVVPIASLLWIRRYFPSNWVLLLAPFLWVGTETLFLEAFKLPIDSGITLARNSGALQFASVLGSAGLTFVIVLAGVLATLGLRFAFGKRFKPAASWLGLSLAVPVAVQALGGAVVPTRPAQPCIADVAVIQPMIRVRQSGISWINPQARTEIRERFWQHLDRVATTSASIVVWPEGSNGFTSFRLGNAPTRLREYAATYNKQLFINATDIDERGRRYNSVFAIDTLGSITKNDKSILLPGAEADTVPGESDGHVLTPLGEVAIAVCFEVCFPDRIRLASASNPMFLLVSTNDAVFGISSMPELHLSASILRAVEMRRSVIHASNTGPSAIIDPYGRIQTRSRFLEETTLHACVPGPAGPSLFQRFGYGFRYLCIAVVLAAMVWVLVYRRRYANQTRTIASKAVLPLVGSVFTGVILSGVLVILSATLMARDAAVSLSFDDIVDSLRPSVPLPNQPGRVDFTSAGQIGAATLAHLASYYGVAVTEDELLRYRTGKGGPVSLSELKQIATAAGYTIMPMPPDIENPGPDALPVLVGIGVPDIRYAAVYHVYDDTVVLFEPLLGIQVIPMQKFRHLYNGQGFRIRPPEQAFRATRVSG